MPHLGEIQSLVGTLRTDGAVSRYYNSLVSTASTPAAGNGAPGGVGADADKRWSWMRYPPAAGRTHDLADDEAIRRNWMGF